MRQLKQMMRARKAQMLWCGPCECLTLKCRKENDEFCGCWWDWPLSLTRDSDYNSIMLELWQTTTIGLTLSKEANVNFVTKDWYYQIQAIIKWADNHYDIQLLASTLGISQWLISDYFSVYDEKWNIIGSIPLYLYAEVESLSIDTTPVTTYLYGRPKIPFTYSPNNAYFSQQISASSDLWQISAIAYWDWQWFLEFYWTEEWTWTISIEAYWSTYSIDVTVGPAVNEITGLDTTQITFDLDNSPSPVTRSFTYSPVDGVFESINVSSDAETVAEISIEKTSDWNWYIQVTPWNEANSSWVHISSSAGETQDIAIETYSQHPNAYLYMWESVPTNIRVWETVQWIFQYAPYELTPRFDSLYVRVENPNLVSATLADLGNNRGEISVTWLQEWYVNILIWNYSSGWTSFQVLVSPSIEDEIIDP